jgi:hypothetical protein
MIREGAGFLVELRGFEPCAFESKAQLVVPEKNCQLAVLPHQGR